MKKIFKDNLMVPSVNSSFSDKNSYTRSQWIIPRIVNYGNINA